MVIGVIQAAIGLARGAVFHGIVLHRDVVLSAGSFTLRVERTLKQSKGKGKRVIYTYPGGFNINYP